MLIGRDPCWIVDPGPALAAHVEAATATLAAHLDKLDEEGCCRPACSSRGRRRAAWHRGR